MNKLPQPSLNPADFGLTAAEHEVYDIVFKRQAKGLTTTSGEVAAAWGGKNRSYTYKVLMALVDKKLIEPYSQRFYRLVKQKEG